MDIVERLRGLASGEMSGEIPAFEYSMAADTIQQQAERIRELEAREIAIKDSKRLQERNSSDRINTLTQQLAEVVEYATKLRAALGDIQNFYHKPVEVWQWSGDALKLPLPDVMQEIK